MSVPWYREAGQCCENCTGAKSIQLVRANFWLEYRRDKLVEYNASQADQQCTYARGSSGTPMTDCLHDVLPSGREPVQSILVRGDGYGEIENSRTSMSDFAHNNASARTCEILEIAKERGV